jgi:hypothetical protein
VRDRNQNRRSNTAELITAICKLIETSAVPIPITLMNHGVDEAAAIIGGVAGSRPPPGP